MKPIEAIAYLRYSPRPDEDETTSNLKQLERCEEHARQRGYAIIDTIEERAVSGGYDENDSDPVSWYRSRPKLFEAIGRLKKGMVLLVRWRDRIGRSVYGQEIVRMDAAKRGATIEATDEPNGDTPEARLAQQLFAAMAELRRWRIKIDTARSMHKYQTEGRRMGRIDRCPFGYKAGPPSVAKPKGSLIKDHAEQKTIELIIDLYTGGKNPCAICDELDARGIKRRGKKWRGARNLTVSILQRAEESNSQFSA